MDDQTLVVMNLVDNELGGLKPPLSVTTTVKNIAHGSENTFRNPWRLLLLLAIYTYLESCASPLIAARHDPLHEAR